MNELCFVDLHTHTSYSDGKYLPQELIDRARAAGIRMLAITDHNRVLGRGEYRALQKANCDMELIRAVELSCRYDTLDNREIEIHLVGLFIDPEDADMAWVLRTNQPDRRPYINAILNRLRKCGIDLGSYEDLRAQFPDAGYLGRMAIATWMVRLGHVKDVDEAFDVYLGGGTGQQRLAYVPNPLKYVTMEDGVKAIEKTGICVLAHLPYYNLPEEEMHRLLSRFKALGGTAMEVEYRRYTREIRDELDTLAKQYGLLPSAASDYHGQNESDGLDNQFPLCMGEALKEAWKARKEDK